MSLPIRRRARRKTEVGDDSPGHSGETPFERHLEGLPATFTAEPGEGAAWGRG